MRQRQKKNKSGISTTSENSLTENKTWDRRGVKGGCLKTREQPGFTEQLLQGPTAGGGETAVEGLGGKERPWVVWGG